MKILLVNDYGVLAGGAERITIDLRDGLRARGHDVRLFASTASPIPLANLADYKCAGTNGPVRSLLQVYNPSAVRRLKGALAEFAPDVVHVRMFLTQLSPRILPSLGGVPALLHVGNHQTVCPLNTKVLPDGSICRQQAGVACRQEGCVSWLGLARTLLQLGTWWRHASVFRLIVANSHALADTLRADGVRVDRVIPNGTREIPPRPPLGSPPTIGFAGRLVAQKGVDVLLRALSLLVVEHREARLVIAGDGPERGALERLAGQLGLAAHVSFCGHLDRAALAARLATSWVQVVPSRSPEPGANVIPEAMMRGTAVVSTRLDGVPEGLRDGATGMLVPAGDPAALATTLGTLLGNRELAERMGASGRSVALGELTTARMIDRFESAYAAMLGSGAREWPQDSVVGT